MSLSLVQGKTGGAASVTRTVLRTDSSERRMEGELALRYERLSGSTLRVFANVSTHPVL